MTNKDKYRVLCSNETSIPIFSRDWWMDAVCGEENWDVLIIERGDEIVAAMPYYFKTRFGKKHINQPSLTQKNGIWINYPQNQKYSTRLTYETEIIREIIDEIEGLNIARYSQNYDYTFTNWLPFYWKDYKQITRYTYVIENIKDIDRVYNDFHHDIKNSIKKAEKKIEVKENLNIEEFYRVCEKTFKRQNKKMPYTVEFINKIDEACAKHNCRKIFYGVDSSQRIHSASYIIWDENSAYSLAGGGDPEFRNSQAMTLILWKAIQFTSSVTEKFDFEGSMVEPIERFFRKYGGIQKPYFNISKDFNAKNLFYVILRDIYDNSKLIKKIFK